ncbi:hypothetical protein HU200_015153 [Digitaria exilis]|uniref:PDZ domain-containing protein n=1 Tax=Digitaria exilis TaxID=1010633 RepID=A0A835FAP6_9POAL|nr:hypothetical protein HU200_015153 [Digitaria exilis]
MLKLKGNPQGCSHGACWSDSDDPPSNFIKYDAESVEGFNKDGLKLFESVFRVRRSVVSLACTADRTRMVCSGTIVDHVDKKTWILTSASLVRKPDTLFEAYEPRDVKIQVALHNQLVEGSLEMCNLHYNIAIVTIDFRGSEHAIELSDLPECYSLQPRPVVALGRDMYSKKFQMRCGELVRMNSELDCTELLTCTCDVSENFIGGPVMDSDRRFLGITFLYRETTLFLPVEIAARCLKYYKKSKTLPRLCIRGQALHMLNTYDLERLCCKYARPPDGILVQEICKVSAEKFGGIMVGDIISELDGITLYSAAQFTAILLDKMEAPSNPQDRLTLQALVRRPADQTIFVAKLNVQDIISDECEGAFQNKYVFKKTPFRLVYPFIFVDN